MCDLETSRIYAPYIYDISSLRVNDNNSEVIVTIGLRSRKTPSVGTPTYCTYTETTGYVLVRVITG